MLKLVVRKVAGSL